MLLIWRLSVYVLEVSIKDIVLSHVWIQTPYKLLQEFSAMDMCALCFRIVFGFGFCYALSSHSVSFWCRLSPSLSALDWYNSALVLTFLWVRVGWALTCRAVPFKKSVGINKISEDRRPLGAASSEACAVLGGLSGNCWVMVYGAHPPLGMGRRAHIWRSPEMWGTKGSTLFLTWGLFPPLPTLQELENGTVAKASMGPAEPAAPWAQGSPQEGAWSPPPPPSPRSLGLALHSSFLLTMNH